MADRLSPRERRKREYQKYLRSDDWKDKRSDKNSKRRRCAICASTEEIHVHHLNYRNLHDVQQSDLRKLCRRCHFLGHELERKGKIVYRSDNHHSKYAIFKAAVKKELGLTGKNMFNDWVWLNRLTDEAEGFCLDPCDWFWRIYGLSVGPFRGYPMILLWLSGLPP